MKFNASVEKGRGITWYRCYKKCDRCGKVYVTPHSKTTEKPDFTELDLCVACLRTLLDDKNAPTYEELKEQLYVPYKQEIKEYESGMYVEDQ